MVVARLFSDELLQKKGAVLGRFDCKGGKQVRLALHAWIYRDWTHKGNEQLVVGARSREISRQDKILHKRIELEGQGLESLD